MVEHTLRVCPSLEALAAMVRRAKGLARATALTAAWGDSAPVARDSLPPDFVEGQTCHMAITSLTISVKSDVSFSNSSFLSGDRVGCISAPFLA